MIKKTSSKQPYGRDSEYITGAFLKSFSIHGHCLGVLFAWMNGYSTLLNNVAPGKYIVIKVEYGLQLHFKIFLNKSDRKNNNKNNH